MGVGWHFVAFADAIRGVGVVKTPFQVSVRRPKFLILPPKLGLLIKTGSSY
ncbi:hypothetical protein OAH36_03745 [Verrucomicrobia bacterium]|nr:hypothetical protein [Verrucomicrobiota bacterium]